MEAAKRIPTGELESRRDAFYSEMRFEASRPDAPEPVIQAFCQAALRMNSFAPAYAAITDNYLAREKVSSPSYQLNKYFVAHQFLMLDETIREQIKYPKNFSNVDTWVEYLSENFSDPKSPMYLQLARALRRPLQTNRPERAKIPALLAGFHETAIDDPFIVCEIGSADNWVGKALTDKKFTKTAVVDAEGQPDRLRSIMFDDYVESAPHAKVYGVEKNPAQSSEDKRWIAACTLKPSQLDRYEDTGLKEAGYDYLQWANFEWVSTIHGDVLNLRDEDMDLLRGKVDLAIISNAMPQIRPFKGLEAVIGQILKPNGEAAINEYAVNRGKKIRLLNRWYRDNWLYKTFIFRNEEPQLGWRPVFVWENGTCDRVRLVEENIDAVAPF